MEIWRDLVLRTVDLQIISPVFQYIRGNLIDASYCKFGHFNAILKLIVGPQLFLDEHTVFYNSFTDLNCRELHRCLESVIPLHRRSSELSFRDDLYFLKPCLKTHKEFVSGVIKVSGRQRI